MSKNRKKYREGGYVAEGKRTKKGSLKYQLETRATGMLELGRSKHEDKRANHGKPRMDKMYGCSTPGRYLISQNMFVRDVMAVVGPLADIMDFRPYAEAWVEGRIEAGLSPNTIHTDVAALAKLFQCHMDDFWVVRPKRCMQNFTHHRNENWKKYYKPEKYPDIELVCHGTGLRRCEIRRLCPQQVKRRSDGTVYILAIWGKGGKIRDVDVLDEYAEAIWALAQEALAAGRAYLTRKPHKHAPIHQYRGWYARQLYRRLARPVESLTRSEQYRSRIMGETYDRAAMQVVSEMLGHSRLSVVINYFQQGLGKVD